MTTSSPGSTVAIIAAIMPSVEPQVTVISRSGSYSSPRNQRVLSLMASRKSFAPQVTAYWFTSSLIAAAAARFKSSGAGKSGKPCERLTAPCFKASRVISRMTDSVKRLAFCETRERPVVGDDVIGFSFRVRAGAAAELFGRRGFLFGGLPAELVDDGV